jgi:O-antigen/teichoic acid export membrane protein
MALGVAAGVSVILTPVLIHGLGPFQYGLWVLVSSVLDYYGLFDLGLRTTLHRFVGRLRATNEWLGLSETLATAIAISAVILGALTLMTVGIALGVPAFFDVPPAQHRFTRWVVMLLGLSVAVSFPSRVLGAYLCGLQRFDLYNAVAIVSAVMRGTLLFWATRAGHGLIGVSAVTLAVAFATVVAYWVLVRWADPGIKVALRHVRLARVRELFGFSVFVSLATVGDYLRFYTDAVVIGRVLGVAAITPFNVGSRLIEYTKLLVSAAVSPTMPEMSALDRMQRYDELKNMFLRATRVAALLSVGMAGLVWLDGDALIRLWIGPDFDISYRIASVLAVSYLVALAQAPSVSVLQALNAHKALALWTMAEGLANIALSVYWAPRYGLLGVALGTAVPMLMAKLTIQPWYTLWAVGVGAREYLSGALARPALVGALFLVIGGPSANAAPGQRYGGSAAIFLWHVALYAALAVGIGLRRSERRELWRFTIEAATLSGQTRAVAPGSFDQR